MFRHVVMFRWGGAAGADEVQAVSDGLEELPTAIPEIVAYRFGPDAGVNEGNWDFAVVADFASVDDYVTYRDHPAHRQLIEERIRPVVSERAAVQYGAD